MNTVAHRKSADISRDSQTPKSSSDMDAVPGDSKQEEKRGFRFYAVFIALAFTSLLSALDASVIGTSLPTIVNDLHSGELYVWTINTYFLTSTAMQPLFGQSANIFGRRPLMIIAILAFTLGSGLAAGASNTGMLIAGRSIQGIGGGGVNMLVDMIVSDMVPQRERGKFMGIIFAIFGIGTTIGPLLGGAIVQNTSWRWVFWINLPVCAAALALIMIFLNMKYDRQSSIGQKLRRVDYSGNALLITAVVAVLLALTWGGTKYPWSSFRIVVPLVLGFLGMAAFLLHQASRLAPEPTMPLRLFRNRTSFMSFVLTFIHSMLMYWVTYFLPIYFQSALEVSPTISGTYLLPFAIIVIPGAIAGGQFVTITGKYRPMQFAGFALMALGIGLFSILDQNSGKALWAIFSIIAGIGVGVLLTATLPAVQAPLPEEDVGTATATWAFLRSFGGVWGVSIPSAIFNSRVNSLLPRVKDAATVALLKDGGAYELASRTFMQSLNHDPTLKSQVVSVYVDALKLVWEVGIAFSLFGLLLVLFVKDVPLKTDLETEFGFEEKPKAKKSSQVSIPLQEA